MDSNKAKCPVICKVPGFTNTYWENSQSIWKRGDKIEAMDKWCKAMEISFTPTIFINGHQLPDAYSIEDLQYFLLE